MKITLYVPGMSPAEFEVGKEGVASISLSESGSLTIQHEDGRKDTYRNIPFIISR